MTVTAIVIDIVGYVIVVRYTMAAQINRSIDSVYDGLSSYKRLTIR